MKTYWKEGDGDGSSRQKNKRTVKITGKNWKKAGKKLNEDTQETTLNEHLWRDRNVWKRLAQNSDPYKDGKI